MSWSYTNKPKRDPGKAVLRRCTECEKHKPTRLFCASSTLCWPCRKAERKATGKSRGFVASGSMTPTEAERRRVQDALEKARAHANLVRVEMGLRGVHGCVPIERDAPLSARGLHTQRVTP